MSAARREGGLPRAAQSPLVELEAELRTLEKRRREAVVRVSRFEPPERIAPGSWSDLERSVHLEQAA